MPDWIQKIQKLPDGQRKGLAFLTMAVMSVVVFSFWSNIFKASLTLDLKPPAAQTASEERKDEGPTPAEWVVQTAGGFSFPGSGLMTSLFGGLGDWIGGFSDTLAEAEQKLLPGFNKFLANVLGIF